MSLREVSTIDLATPETAAGRGRVSCARHTIPATMKMRERKTDRTFAKLRALSGFAPLSEIIYVTNVNFRLSDIKTNIVSFAGGVADVEYTGLRFQRQTKTGAKETVVDFLIAA